jgi:hypothetical protein
MSIAVALGYAVWFSTFIRSPCVDGAEMTKKHTSSEDLFINLCRSPGATSIPELAGIRNSSPSISKVATPDRIEPVPKS